MPEKRTFEVVKKEGIPEPLKRIDELIKQIKFGSVTIHVEDGHVIQVDKNEKIRFK